jgi:CSLREA domain-containing protein
MLYRDLANRSKASRPRLPRSIRCAAGAIAFLLVLASAHATTFNVNSPADVPDATPGDGKCETAAGNQVCTLRAAVQEANALAGADVINLQANATYLLTRVGIENASAFGSLDISDSVDIVGAGPASSIVDGDGSVTNDRVFQILPCIGNDVDCALGEVVVTMTGIAIRHGQTPDNGGGLYAPGGPSTHSSMVTLTNCRIEGNAADSGGGIFSLASFTLISSVVAGNTAASGGGAFLFNKIVISDSTFSDNESDFGGGIVFAGRGSIARSTINGNHGGEGGGILTETSNIPPYELYISNSTIAGNSSDAQGGGLYNIFGTTNLFNVTIAGNVANADRSGSDFGGGGVFNTSISGAAINFTNSIIANNTSLVSGSLFTVLNDCSGIINSQGFNIVRYDTCTVLGGSYSTDAVLFGPLEYNGGPTRTLALLEGSGGIDKGNPAGCTDDLGATLPTDQRGRPRTVGVACDLGAYEVQPNVIFQDGFDL